MYDDNNIFAKIIRKEIPCKLVYEDKKVLFFYDINPQAKIHILGVPKNSVINFREFIFNTDKDTIKYFFDKTSSLNQQYELLETLEQNLQVEQRRIYKHIQEFKFRASDASRILLERFQD